MRITADQIDEKVLMRTLLDGFPAVRRVAVDVPTQDLQVVSSELAARSGFVGHTVTDVLVVTALQGGHRRSVVSVVCTAPGSGTEVPIAGPPDDILRPAAVEAITSALGVN